MQIIINNKFKHLLPSLTEEQQNGLEQDILMHGCLQPLITWNGVLVDGHHRYDICQKHGISFEIKEMQFDSELDAMYWSWNNQKNRRNLSAYELGKQALMFESLFKEKANINQGTRTDILAISPKGLKSINTREEMAKIAGIGSNTINKIKAIEATAPIEVKQKLQTQEISINQAYQQVKKDERKQEYIAKIQNKELPAGKYQVIYADPPWQYSNSGFNTSAEAHYNTMDIKAICELPINELADENSILFLWTTTAMAEEAFSVIKAWGFEYKTQMVWVKNTHIAGFYVYGKYELLYLATKGSFLPIGEKVENIITGENSKHSKKPEQGYNIIEKMYPDCKYIELFARQTKQGWKAWGNEVN